MTKQDLNVIFACCISARIVVYSALLFSTSSQCWIYFAVQNCAAVDLTLIHSVNQNMIQNGWTLSL